MRKILISFFISLSLFTICAAQTADQAEVPFKFQQGLLIVDAKIKGETAVQMAISTGSQYSIIDSEQMIKHKLQAAYAADDVVRGAPTDSTYTFVPVSSVSMQGSKSRDLQMRVGSMKRVSEAAGAEIFGALGSDFFEGQIVQLDFKKSVIRFLSKSPDTKGATGDNAPIVLRMGEKESNPFKKTFVTPNVTGAKINGKETKLLLDTGRATTIALSANAAKKAGLTAPEENEQPRTDKISLDLAGHQIAELPVAIFPKGAAGERSMGGHTAIAGSQLLKDFLVTLDFKGKTVILEKQ